MKRYLRWFLLVAIAVMPLAFAACDDDEGDGTEPTEEITGTIRGTVTAEGQGLSGVTVNLSGPTSSTTQTGSDGSYSFANVPAGTYSVDIGAVSNAVFSTSSKVVVIQSQDQVATVNFQGQFLRNSRIEGIVSARGEAVSGVTVTLSGAGSGSTLTDASGSFSFENLAAGDYTVEISDFPSSITFSTTSKSVTLGTGESQAVTFSGTAPPSATVSIQSITVANTNTPVNPNNVAAQIDITVNLDPDDEDITSVELRIDDEVVREQTFSSGSSGAEGAPSQVEEIVFSVNTAETGVPMDQWDGTQVDGRWNNGVHNVSARANTDQGDFVETGGTDLNFNNTSFVQVHHLEGGQGIVSGGVRWWGGEDIKVAVTPVIFDGGTTVGSVTISGATDAATANATGTGDVDFGNGSGAQATDGTQPFQFTAAFADNLGVVEDDATVPTAGHSINIDRLLDSDGVDITPQFGIGQLVSLNDFFMDFVAPDANNPAASELTIDGADIADAGTTFYSEGAFGVSNLVELGVGQTIFGFDIDDSATADDPDFTGVSSLADLAERDEGADASDFYHLVVTSITDALGNTVDLTTDIVDASTGSGGTDPAAYDVDNQSEGFGLDRTEHALSDMFPASDGLILNPDDDNADGTANNDLLFTAEDPLLADGTAGSGDGAFTTDATDPDGNDGLTPAIVVNGAAPDWLIDLNDAVFTGAATPDGAWTVSFTTNDNAVPANQNGHTFSFIRDGTDPVFNVTQFPQGGTATAATAEMDIAGNVTDANGLSDVTLTIKVDGTDADGAGSDGVCQTTDYDLSVGAGEVDKQDVDKTSNADNFSETFTISEPAASPVVVKYCIFIFGADNATDNEGNAEPNTGNLFATADIDWQ